LRNVSPTVPSPYETWTPVLPENVRNPLARPIRVQEQEISIEVDLVVIAGGLEPDDVLYEACVRQGVAAEIHNIGDSFMPRSISEATKAGYAIGRSL
jgi:2-enoate reductase